MLCLLLSLGSENYALPCRDVVRLVPSVELKSLPQAPAYVAGLFNYRGRIVPVIDLCALTLGRPAGSCLSSRIVLVHYGKADNGTPHLLGLLAESMTETIVFGESDLAPAGVALPHAPFLGSVASTDAGMVQMIDVGRLLTPEAKALLFPPALLPA
jgi:chemotaxis-related protein WspB